MVEPVVYRPDVGVLELIDQTLLPGEKKIIACTTVEEVAQAITTMQVRGAPAIGVAAAFGIYLGVKSYSDLPVQFPQFLDKISNRLASTRPTAVNLFWALDRMKQELLQRLDQGLPEDWHRALEETAYKAAEGIRQEDIGMCQAIGRYGAEFLRDGETWLTHCNAGALATGGYGTALGVFRAAREAGKKFHVLVDETRPLLQGARLTAWELQEEHIDATLICDNMAAAMMAEGRVQAVVVGADRITTDGYVANKIGTYGLAVLASYHHIPFYVAAPLSTFDPKIAHGREIIIEERSPDEVRRFGGRLTAPAHIPTANPAFDVTPPELITAIFTNRGVLRAPFRQGIHQLLNLSGA